MFNRKKKRIAELEEELARAVTAKDKFYDKLIQEWKRNTKLVADAKELEEKIEDLEDENVTLDITNDRWIKSFNEEHKKVHELEKDLDIMRRQRGNYYDEAEELREKLKNVELELEQTKKSSDHWYNQFEHVSGECNAYAAITKKFMAVHEDGDVDDTHIIHNGKVYTIIGVKHIVDNLGDTLDIRAELIDPEKIEEKKIGFKPEEVTKEDK